MNWENLIQTVLTATIPAVLTFFATKRSNESKIKEIIISKDSEIQQIKLQHQHEIEKLESEHKHYLETLELEHRFQKESKSNEISTKLAEMFFSGELDLDEINSSIPKIQKLKDKVNRMSNNANTSNFVKKHKSK